PPSGCPLPQTERPSPAVMTLWTGLFLSFHFLVRRRRAPSLEELVEGGQELGCRLGVDVVIAEGRGREAPGRHRARASRRRRLLAEDLAQPAHDALPAGGGVLDGFRSVLVRFVHGPHHPAPVSPRDGSVSAVIVDSFRFLPRSF